MLLGFIGFVWLAAGFAIFAGIKGVARWIVAPFWLASLPTAIALLSALGFVGAAV